MSFITDELKKCNACKSTIAGITTNMRARILYNSAVLLDENRKELITANKIDLENAEKNKLAPDMIDRLTITNSVINSMINSLNDIAMQPDVLGEVIEGIVRPNGLKINKIRVPIGVVVIIYESRPNVTIDATALAIKSGNCIVLRGGKEAINSNKFLIDILHSAIRLEKLPTDIVLFIDDTNRELIKEVISAKSLVDMVIPRGGSELINFVTDNSLVPVIKHDRGVCHVYVDAFADLDKAFQIAFNAKMQRPSACNAMETLLVHSAVANKFLPNIATALQELDVDLRSCEKALKYVDSRPAIEQDWYDEYASKILAIKVVESLDEAIAHIEKYGSHHSDAIITDSYSNAMRFINDVDSSAVYINASTRFTDGAEFGLGAEMGISTQKLHVRGPMGARDLTTTKYQIFGNGQLRS